MLSQPSIASHQPIRGWAQRFFGPTAQTRETRPTKDQSHGDLPPDSAAKPAPPQV